MHCRAERTLADNADYCSKEISCGLIIPVGQFVGARATHGIADQVEAMAVYGMLGQQMPQGGNEGVQGSPGPFSTLGALRHIDKGREVFTE